MGVTSEIKRFREQQAQAEKERQATQMREDRMKDLEHAARRKDRQEREFRDAEMDWEEREKDIAIEKERLIQHRKEKERKRAKDIENENTHYDTWHRHVNDSYRIRDRRRERKIDKEDKEREER